jgi:hypothetical protein
MRPGFIIKFFNGLEKRVPLSDFGEEFVEVVRFNQSSNGKFAIISGTKRDYYELKSGIFMYEIGVDYIKRIAEFPFAEKDEKQLDLEIRIKI